MFVSMYEINLLHIYSTNIMNFENSNGTVKLSAKVGKSHSMHKILYSLLQSTRERMKGNGMQKDYLAVVNKEYFLLQNPILNDTFVYLYIFATVLC
jgi:hypothetical protein